MKILAGSLSLGYEVHLEGDNLKLPWCGGGNPDPAQIMPLLENLKSRKGQVVEHLRKQGDFETVFNQALREINRQYEPGTIPYIWKNYPALWQKVIETENRLGDLWLAGEVESFRRALRK